MVKAALDELGQEEPTNHFTVGIRDDVTHHSLAVDPEFDAEPEGVRALFFGMGSDGSVGAAKNTIRIIGEETELHTQGYFVYDSKKAGAVTVSHLRFGPAPIRSSYCIESADFVAVHHFGLLERLDVLSRASAGATLLLNAPVAPEQLFGRLPREVQETILEKQLRVWTIDADRVAREVGMDRRINTVMQPCFFALSGVLPRERAVDAIKRSIERSYGKRGKVVVRRNLAAVDRALEALHEVDLPARVDSEIRRRAPVPPGAGDFVSRVTARLLAGEGDLLPVSALPPDGTFPTGTARFEKRRLAPKIPIWDPEICIDCGKCAIACPHAAIRMNAVEPGRLDAAPEGFRSKPFRSRELPDRRLVIQVTGCGVCADVCPAKSKEKVKHRALDMEPIEPHLARERASFEYFLGLPEPDRAAAPPGNVKNSQLREPLFEFSGACAGCGETPYLKLLSQLFGDRMVIANATGCSSIYGGNLPTTPWSRNAEGRGPAWANSLFEDNAEFGLGILLGLEAHVGEARRLVSDLAPSLGQEFVREILEADQSDDGGIAAQRERVAHLKARLTERDPVARRLAGLAEDLVRKSVWIVGGDGWAYDIGSAGLDHVLASSRNVNVLVLDTQVYSNTGGQASKATPRAAVAKFAAFGKAIPRKDLGMMATAYGNVYVAQVALGGNDQHTVHALMEADAWEGPSLVIAYSTCIAHGIDMARSISHQSDAVKSGFWPLWRYHPGLDPHQHPFQLDSRKPTLPLHDFTQAEARFAVLERSDPERAHHLLTLAQADADERWRFYSQLAQVERTLAHEEESE
jgi:pyruvate-ferredoxin/flavodoxin oxidoreductase